MMQENKYRTGISGLFWQSILWGGGGGGGVPLFSGGGASNPG